MRTPTLRFLQRQTGFGLAIAALALLAPATASAQYTAPDLDRTAIGEKYRIEASGSFWKPKLVGLISSEQFQLIGSDIDVVRDLGYRSTSFRDLRVVGRPSKKSKFRFQYTPIHYAASTTLRREIIFNGIKFSPAVPVQSEFSWKIMRFGYEYDFLYFDRGFVGMLLDVRYTQFNAKIKTSSTLLTEEQFTSAKAPLPAFGIVGRGYVLPNIAINFEVSGFRLPDVDEKYAATYWDWDIHGTVNVNQYFGVQIGWRKMSNFMRVEKDLGDLNFQGVWFGAAVRY